MEMKYVLRLENKHKCKAEPRFEFYAGNGNRGNTTDRIAVNVSDVTVFTAVEIEQGVFCSLPDWEAIPLNQARRMKGYKNLGIKN